MAEVTHETVFKVLKEIKEKYREESWWQNANAVYLKTLGFHILVSTKKDITEVIDLPLYQQGVLIVTSDSDMFIRSNSFDFLDSSK